MLSCSLAYVQDIKRKVKQSGKINGRVFLQERQYRIKEQRLPIKTLLVSGLSFTSIAN